MEQLALDQIQIPLWTPEFPDIDTDLRKFIWDLKIPRARAPNDHIPDMLLHKLGRFQKNESLRNRLTSLLGTKNHKAFVNTSGSGKTRMILEHLCSRWGIYLTCHEESRVGSSDLMMAISLIEQRLVDIPQPAILQVTTQQLAEFNDTQGVVCTEQQCLQERFNGNSLLPTFKSSSEGKNFRRALEANHQVVTSELLIVILARLAILRQREGRGMHQPPKRAKKSNKKIEWIVQNLSTIETLTPEALYQETHPTLEVYARAVEYQGVLNWNNFFRQLKSVSLENNPKAIHVVQNTYLRFIQSKDLNDQATHQEKRRLILHLGINHKSYTLASAIIQGESSFKLPCGTILNLVQRDFCKAPFPLHTQMYDSAVPLGCSGAIVDEAHGFRIVLETESVLFYTGDHSKFIFESIKLVVIRGVGMTPPTADSKAFYSWLAEVIEFGCYYRRNQRHLGKVFTYKLVKDT
ncbi:hypothetical protein LENED_005660 [Lentinula edodes]|uniref:Uncharacterized protein n=1 Tax=Lentinula edodes TaxID=5353 RepID=A0A1Q3E9L9_LENED|nr:hypothetical protein LENED_005660 [Lentinula edodes]